MSSPTLSRPLDILPGRRSPSGGTSSSHVNHAPKRKRSENESDKTPAPARRKTACQSCRTRKVKCDNVRPSCGFCITNSVECVYIESAEDKLVLDPATKLMVSRLDQILKGVEGISSLMQNQGASPVSKGQPSAQPSQSPIRIDEIQATLEPSKDYLHVPPCRGSADSILLWPIFKSRFPPDTLIGVYYKPTDRYAENETNGKSNSSYPGLQGTPDDTWNVPGGFQFLPDEKIPTLIDRFLQNVHTKNPLLDVDALVRWGRAAAEHGLGWDAPSCIVLLACALGALSYPISDSTEVLSPCTGTRVPAKTSSMLYAKELRQAESCFVLACRRLGLLKYSIIGAQCHFFAGVYLMYTLRPLPSWNHFYQASTFFQFYLKTVHGPTFDDTSSPDAMPPNGVDRTKRRLEQSLYWSCFKSEVEFRVELPTPQSAIADFEYPTMFPSPPSPPPFNIASETPGPLTPWQYSTPLYMDARAPRTSDSMLSLPDDEWDIRRHNRDLCNEEQSWYYYLTEVALRRISNRIKNTFYEEDPSSWRKIELLIPIAVEFEAQIATWSASLPPVMQHYESSLSPGMAVISTPTESHTSASKELSWATVNRLLEMSTWLYQPFLYYAIHCPKKADDMSWSRLGPDQQAVLERLIKAGVECNMKTLESRCLHHRHHGIWYDLRSLVAATATLVAVAKSGNVEIPGGLFGNRDIDGNPTRDIQQGDRFTKVFEGLRFWEDEAPDIKRGRKILEKLVDDMR